MFDFSTSWQERHQVSRHANRPNAWPASTVRNTKRLVQVEVANVGAVIAGAAKTDLRVHVGAVHVNLAAVRVHDLANLADSRFKNAMCARIRHHERGQIARVLVCLRAQVGKIDISIFETRYRNDFESGHDRARRICPMRRSWN